MKYLVRVDELRDDGAVVPTNLVCGGLNQLVLDCEGLYLGVMRNGNLWAYHMGTDAPVETAVGVLTQSPALARAAKLATAALLTKEEKTDA